MEDLLIRVFGIMVDKLGINGILSALLLGLLVLEIRRHGETKKELTTERAARVEDLKTVLPVVQASTQASQATSTSLAKVSEGLEIVRDLVLSSIREGQR